MSGKDRRQWSCLAKLTRVTSDSDLFAGRIRGLEGLPALFTAGSLPSHLLHPQPCPMEKRPSIPGQDSPFSPASSLHVHTLPCSPAPCPIRRPAVSEGENPGGLVPGVVGTLPASCPVCHGHHGQETYSLRAQFLLFMEKACAFPAGG